MTVIIVIILYTIYTHVFKQKKFYAKVAILFTHKYYQN